MQENTRDMADVADGGCGALESRSRTLFQDSVDGMDFGTLSRLTRARHAALEAAVASERPRLLRTPMWKPAAGVAAAAVLGVTLWFGALSGNLAGTPGMSGDSQGQANLEDLDIVAASEPGAADAIDMLQDDLDFYDFVDKADNGEPAA